VIVSFVVFVSFVLTTPMAYKHLLSQRKGPVEYLTLNRPDVRNAFNDEMVAELAQWAAETAGDRGVRAAVVAGAGKVFCAGADLAWMARMVSYTQEENVADATATAAMFAALDALPFPLIGRVHGAALGGGAGLAAVCDIVVAEDHAVFGFTEVKLGILPSMIAPFVLRRIGHSAARELFLTGLRFDAVRAREIGLVHAITSALELDTHIERYLQECLSAAPEAVATAKALLREIAGRPAADVRTLTAETIATRRASREGQEGMKAFLEKRTPSWNVNQ
jgi:methylglutaconyl-CoA hydratase